MTSTLLDNILPIARAALPVLFGLLLLVAGRWVYVEFLEEAPETFGQLVVDSPEIYTRERLVNDRFVEDAWLRRKLRETDKADFTPTGSVASRDSSAMQLTWGAAAGDEGGDAALTPRDIARRDASALFRSELTYRSEIRNLIIENQLDDRHDLRGNSLFRLKFDASVLPGDNTRANALISVTLEEPPRPRLGEKDVFFTAFDPEELKRWRHLFDAWRRDIDESINQVISDLKYDYRMNRFPPEYIDDFFFTMEQCENYDRAYYDRNVRPLVESGADLRQIKIHIEEMRKKLTGCTTSMAQATPGIAEPTNEEPTKSTVPKQETEVAENTKTAPKPPSRVRRRLVKIERADAVSRNELIHRFAAPRLFQQIFGRDTVGGRLSGSIAVWDFFYPYAVIVAVYREDEEPFRLGAVTTDLIAHPVNNEGKCDSEGILLPWKQDDYSFLPWTKKAWFCLKTLSSDMVTFLDSMNITERDLSSVLAKDPDLNKKLEPMIADGGDWVGITVESGLFAFIRDLQQSNSVFSYAVTPKQAVQSLVVDDQTDRQGTVAAAANGLGGQLGGDRSIGFSGVREQPLVVGYGDALGGNNGQPEGDAKAEFGWLISPPVQGADHASLQKVHPAAQYALTALVSVPAWWDKIDLKVKRTWIDQHGNRKPVTAPDGSRLAEDAVVTIDLPSDLESINSLLFGDKVGPKYEEGKMKEIVLTACRPAAILLPGRRLWRSTVVTLGPQTADEIQVLPNMRGIIAKFDRVDMPSGWSDLSETHEVPVTIWTSEGMSTLRKPAKIRMPMVAAIGVAGDGVLAPNGTCQEEPRRGDP